MTQAARPGSDVKGRMARLTRGDVTVEGRSLGVGMVDPGLLSGHAALRCVDRERLVARMVGRGLASPAPRVDDRTGGVRAA